MMTRRPTVCSILLFGFFFKQVSAQQNALSVSEPGAVKGTVTDATNSIVPGAEIALQNYVTGERRSAVSRDDGSYAFDDLQPGFAYIVTITAAGFAPWTSPVIRIGSGETRLLIRSELQHITDTVSVTVYASQQPTATEQVKIEEGQRAFGIFPNFYVVYDHNTAPLTAKLKFKLGWKASTDPVIFAVTAVTAAADQATDTPGYKQGANGYGQRVGALYANGFTDIMVGEAILPALLHQDPRYFYQGSGTGRSRLLHALSSAFLCKGDNGKLEPNYSNIGGDLASGAISNIYYPRSNRGVGTVFENALIASGGRLAHRLAQEFILRRFTPGAKDQAP